MITVIIPYFNRKDTIERAIQSCFNLRSVSEILIIDDEKTFNSRNTLSELSLKYEIVSFHLSNGSGAYHARIYGASLATNNNIVFLDSDDELTQQIHFLEAELLSSQCSTLVSCEYYVNERIISRHDLSVSSILKRTFSCAPFSAIAIHLATDDNLPFLNLCLDAYQDDDFCIRLLVHGFAYKYVNSIGVRLHASSASSRISNQYKKKIHAYNKFLVGIRQLSYFRNKPVAQAHIFLSLLLNHILLQVHKSTQNQHDYSMIFHFSRAILNRTRLLLGGGTPF